ncbi:hypothetical protein C2G38_336997 [Gigaspora rosea]|uniref:Uncharacterized protein n=1 Tax=Gigaspora rosea TaxID=44941 RepID=A0A397UE63_9GLOM|nr:hypothetical protein C2G38_336997 [Gigaspora rosea]
MKCIATFSEEDESIVVWSITNELMVNYDSSLNINDLEHALNTDKFCKMPDYNFKKIFDGDSDVLLGISNCKQVIIRLSDYGFAIDFAIIDIRTKLRQILNAQGLKGETKSVAFLENEDLVIIKLRPVYRAYIFSKSNSNLKQKWTCKNSIELEKKDVELCYISKNGKLFMCLDKIMPVVMQWDLKTRKFDVQYILDLNLKIWGIRMELNSDNTLLAIGNNEVLGDGSVVCVYLTKSGMMIANSKYFYVKLFINIKYTILSRLIFLYQSYVLHNSTLMKLTLMKEIFCNHLLSIDDVRYIIWSCDILNCPSVTNLKNFARSIKF